jgi:hypothetical protein
MSRKPKPKSKNLPTIMPTVDSMIHVVRGQKVMLDSDLAALYQVRTSNLTTAVKRNINRFPPDFMFSISDNELHDLRLQSAASSLHGGRRYQATVFTELGVAMLSSVLGSERAVQMNIAIMRAFVKLRAAAMADKELAARVEKLETKQSRTASVIEVLVEDIDRIDGEVKKMKRPMVEKKHKIGFQLGKKR